MLVTSNTIRTIILSSQGSMIEEVGSRILKPTFEDSLLEGHPYVQQTIFSYSFTFVRHNFLIAHMCLLLIAPTGYNKVHAEPHRIAFRSSDSTALPVDSRIMLSHSCSSPNRHAKCRMQGNIPAESPHFECSPSAQNCIGELLLLRNSSLV